MRRGYRWRASIPSDDRCNKAGQVKPRWWPERFRKNAVQASRQRARARPPARARATGGEGAWMRKTCDAQRQHASESVQGRRAARATQSPCRGARWPRCGSAARSPTSAHAGRQVAGHNTGEPGTGTGGGVGALNDMRLVEHRHRRQANRERRWPVGNMPLRHAAAADHPHPQRRSTTAAACQPPGPAHEAAQRARGAARPCSERRPTMRMNLAHDR